MMNEGEICARHYQTGQVVTLRWQAGKITHLAAAEPSVSSDWWLAPALVDLQINGYGGIDFQQDELSLADLLTATRQLQTAGCTRWLFTLVTEDWSRLMARLRHLRALRAQSPQLTWAIQGWHIEGPFLSPEPGFHGAHDPRHMCDPTPEQLEELRAVTGSDRVLLTLAPERAGALAAIALATNLRIQVSLGHTNAPAELLSQAARAGATGFTHLGNGCPNELNRHDNILWRVFDGPQLRVGLIPDRIHVSPAFFRLCHRLLDGKLIYYTTDAMSAAGAPPGRYRIGPLEVEVGADQIVRQPGRANFAGSALRPIEGVFRAAEMLRCPWQNTWSRMAEQPAQWIGLRHGLASGCPADFCLLKTTDSLQPTDLRVYARGELVP